MQHRLFLVPPRLGDDVERARRHWEERHGAVFVRTPGLLGYVQNRPVDEEWLSGRGWFCSETWYADRDSERRAYASTYYQDVVAQDEATFLDRSAAWSAVMLDDRAAHDVPGGGLRTSRWRVLWLSDARPPGHGWAVLPVTRAVPGGDASLVLRKEFDDRAEALAVTRGASCPAFVCEPTTFDPPTSWSPSSPREVRR